ncbi:hypothetical protein NLJ89_g1289 [Agrocybe chaxingu]|uniref:F-box domain-containing protein n=1 Tax=Agrocybe chaxingu TaxID=84603 RepID=A0A9W8N0D1_9AGAR|nr:hypothetical protein NLJ89_g1289 [Agrocybe chaxingu]
MAYIRYLPAEMLGEIFLHCLPERPREESQPNTKIAPILLCHVCSAWRTTALRLPKLWTRLCMRSTFKVLYPLDISWLSHTTRSAYKELPMHPRTLDFLTWLGNNARSVPIDLYLIKIKEENVESDVEKDGIILDGTPPGHEAMNTLEFALARLPSVRHFEMAINRYAMEVLCKAATPTTFERLESLTVHQYFHIGYKSRTKFVFAFPPAPRLRRLALTSYMNTLSFHWGQLTHLCISCAIEQEDWLEILTHCENLSSGAFHLDGWGEGDLPSIVHPNLRQLVIVPTTFRHVSFPGLKALRILRNESISTFKLLADLLRKTPALTELHFDSEVFNSDRFEVPSNLLPEESIWLPSLLPDLSLLGFEFTECGTNSTGSVIVELLKSEWVKLPPRNGRPSHLRISFIPGIRGIPEDALPVVTAEELDSMKKSDIVRAIEEIRSASEGNMNIELRFPALGDEKRRWEFPDYFYDAEDLPRWDEVMGFHEQACLCE